MGRIRKKQNLAGERALRKEFETQNALLRSQVEQFQLAQARGGGYYSAPAPRRTTVQFDWNCECGEYNFASRRICRRCQSSRFTSGETVPGTIRGEVQNTRSAAAAVAAQARVPASFVLPPPVQTANGAKPHLVSPTTRVLQRKQSTGAANSATATGASGNAASAHVHAKAKATVSANASGAAGHAGNATSAPARAHEAPVSALQRLAADNLQNDADDNISHGDNADNAADDNDSVHGPASIVEEELGYKQIEFKLIKLETKIQKRKGRHEKEVGYVQEQEREIEAQRAKMVELQASADATKDEISDLEADRDDLIKRLSELAKADKRADESKEVVPKDPQSAQVRDAYNCLSKAFQGFQNYDSADADIQGLLSVFATAFNQLQLERAAAVGGGKQPTLPQYIADQQRKQADPAKAQPSLPPAPSTGTTHFDISDSQKQQSGAGVEETTPMQIVGEGVGDKRKAEQMATSQVDCVPEISGVAGAQSSGGITVATSSAQQNPARVEEDSGYRFGSTWCAAAEYMAPDRKTLCADLRQANRQQAIDRKARTELAHQKSNPY